MSNKFRNDHSGLSVYQLMLADVQNVRARTAGIASAQVAQHLTSLESLSPTGAEYSAIQSSRQEIEAALRESPTFGTDFLGKLTKEQQVIALEAASMTLMAAGNPAIWHSAAAKPQAPNGTKLVNPNQGYLDYRQDFTVEGFEPASFDQFIAQSAVVNALVAIQGGYEEAFFPIQVVPANTNGIDLSISIPKVTLPASTRSSNGSAYQITKTNIIKALIDNSVLEPGQNVTKIIPNIDNAFDKMVANGTAAGEYPQLQVVVNGTPVDTNPLLPSVTVDLIGASNSGAVTDTNETDTLDHVINVGVLYADVNLRLAAGGGDVTPALAKFKFDVSSQMGSLLQSAAEGQDRAYLTTFRAKMILGDTYTDAAANETAVLAKLTAIGAAYAVLEVTVSAQANTEYGSMEVNFNNLTITYYTSAGVVVNPTAATATAGDARTKVLGYYPAARRTNSNFRSKGTLIDSTSCVSFRFPVPLQAPFISQNPVGGQVNTSIEGLAMAERIRNSNNAVKALLAVEEILAAGNGLPVGNSLVGAEYSITPTYIQETLDLQSLVISLNSKESLDNLRGALTAAIMVVVDRMIQQSGYLAALEFVTNNNTDYEVIMATDSRISPWLMESGDTRFLGANRKFKVTQSINDEFHGRIYISLRRATRDGNVSGLDFGFFAYTPALTHTVQVSRGGSTTQEIHTVPRGAHYVTLPILGRLDVTNLQETFTESI